MKKLMSIVVVAVMLLQAMVSLGGAVSGAPATQPKTLNIAMQQDMPNFNYWDLASNSVWKKYAFGAFCFEGLSQLDPSGAVYPCLATSWTFDEPSLTVTVNLRQGVKFHDGTLMTADDVVFSFQGFRDGTTLSSPIIDAFDQNGDGKCSAAELNAGVTKVNDTVVKFTMAKRYGQFFLQTLGTPVVPKAIWQSHLTADGTFDTLWNDQKATIGTGSLYYSGGVKNSYRELKRWDGYWGKTFKTPGGYSLYPQNIDVVHFSIYSSLDTAILALKSGQVDHIPWAVTPGYVSDLIANPNTGVMSISDNGYFYLAFNMKREPMNMLPFRQAVSYCIDKETITQRYMGGYGQPGDSSEPPFWTDWYNSSVDTYPFNVQTARTVLQTAGFTGIGTSLKMPDGRPVPPLILLTPPADYDPIRIKAGELIAKNLRGLGIDVVAKPVDFDTLVAKMNAFDYDMLIIGWSLSQDPVGNVFDILGPLASQNYFGFWDPVLHDNLWYNKIGGVDTRADAATRALADQVYDAQLVAKQSFDRDTQIRYTKLGQGLLAKALPCNVIYYRVNNYAIAKSWTGWTPFMGELLHIYSLGKLVQGATPPPGEQLTSILNVPDKLPYNVATDAWVLVVNNEGLPISGATITMTGTGVTSTPATGTTDASGVFKFSVKGTQDGYVTINAKADSGTNTYTATKVVSVQRAVSPTYYLTVNPDKLFLNPGESTAVAMKVTDQDKNPVAGVTIDLDEGLLGYGSVDSHTKVTAADGTATMTYTAPTVDKIPINKHLQVRLSLTVDPTSTVKADLINTVTQFIIVKNTSPSDWHFVSISNIDKYSCNATNATTNLTIKTFDKDGAAIPNEELTVSYSNAAVLTSPPATVTTNATGFANLALTWASGIDTNATQLYIKSRNFPNAAGAGVCLLFNGTTVPTNPLYGGMSFVSGVPIVNPNSGVSLPFTAMLWGLDGKLPTGQTQATLVIGEPTDGSTATLENAPAYMYSSLTDYAAVQVSTSADKAVLTSGGYFETTLYTDAEINTLNGGSYTTWTGLENDAWTGVDVAGMKPATFTNGTMHFNVTSDSLVLSDNVPHVLIAPMGKMGFYVTPDGNNYYWVLTGPTCFKTDFVMQRSMKVTSVKYSLPDGIMRDMAPGNVSTGQITVYDQDGNVVAGVGMSATISVRSPLYPFFTTKKGPVTGADGKTTFTVTALTKDSKANPLSNPAKQPLYLQATAADSVNVFLGTEVSDMPMQLYLGLEVTPDIALYTQTGTAKAKLYDETGAAVSGVDVTFSVDVGSLSNATKKTDAAGMAQVTFTPILTKGQFYEISTILSQAQIVGYGPASSAFSVVAYVTAPVMGNFSIPVTGYTTKNTTVSISGKAFAVPGIDHMNYTLDSNATVVPVTIPTSGLFTISLTNLAVGTHTLHLNMMDKNGLTSTKTITFTVEKPAKKANNFPMMWVAVIVIVIILIIIIAAVAMRGGEESKPEERPEVVEVVERKEEP